MPGPAPKKRGVKALPWNAYPPAENKSGQRRASSLDALAGVLHHVSRRGVRYPEMGRHTKGRAMNHGHAFSFKQVSSHILIACDDFAFWCAPPEHARALWINIECPFRRWAGEALGLIEHRDSQIAALFEDEQVVSDKVLRSL